MNEYGVVQLGDYLLSVPGAIIYTVTIVLLLLLSRGVASEYFQKNFRLTAFLLFLVASSGLWTWLFVQIGLWFYVKA